MLRNIQWHFSKMVRPVLLGMISTETTAVWLYSGGQRLASTMNTGWARIGLQKLCWYNLKPPLSPNPQGGRSLLIGSYQGIYIGGWFWVVARWVVALCTCPPEKSLYRGFNWVYSHLQSTPHFCLKAVSLEQLLRALNTYSKDRTEAGKLPVAWVVSKGQLEATSWWPPLTTNGTLLLGAGWGSENFKITIRGNIMDKGGFLAKLL